VATVAAVWIPWAAVLAPANEAHNEVVPDLIEELPPHACYLLGDLHYNAPNVRRACQRKGRMLITTQYGPYPNTDGGATVRRVFHELRSRTIEDSNGQFKGIFDANGQVPTKGLVNTQRFALGAIFVYQLALLYRYEHGMNLRVGLKPFPRAA
jgi:hypothetical protein